MKRTIRDKVLAVFIISAFASVVYYTWAVQRLDAVAGMFLGMGIAFSLIVRGLHNS